MDLLKAKLNIVNLECRRKRYLLNIMYGQSKDDYNIAKIKTNMV